MSIQRFKENDDVETKTLAAFLPPLDTLGVDHDDFYAGTDTAGPLGDLLFALDRHPLAGILDAVVFRNSFWAINDLFTRPGTFEFYLTVFRAIWGEDVEVEFTIPDPGKLQIGISGVLTPELSYLTFREIVGVDYVYSHFVTQGGDLVLAQGTQGIKTQTDANRLIAELAVQGVYTTITLSL